MGADSLFPASPTHHKQVLTEAKLLHQIHKRVKFVIFLYHCDYHLIQEGVHFLRSSDFSDLSRSFVLYNQSSLQTLFLYNIIL